MRDDDWPRPGYRVAQPQEFCGSVARLLRWISTNVVFFFVGVGVSLLYILTTM